jgi:hypothetical protein
MSNTTGRVYFAIGTEDDHFDIHTFNRYLTIQPTNFRKKFEKGNLPVSTIWEYASEELKNPFYFEEIEKLIDLLEKHISEFIHLKIENPSIDYVLQVVIYLGDETPGLHFSERTIKFINDIGGTIDCDIYNANS